MLSHTNIGAQGWFIFTTILLICTLRSTVAFFTLFFTLDMAFMLLGIAYLTPVNALPQPGCLKAGGVFALLAAFLAWYANPLSHTTLLTNHISTGTTH